MLSTTRGIVLSSFDYSETSLICRIYTLEGGLLSYIAKGVRRKNARMHRNLFAPLTLLQISANHKSPDQLTVLRDASCYRHMPSMGMDIKKVSISLFMAEMLVRCLSTPHPDAELYEFIEHEITSLNQAKGNYSSFPLRFATHLTRHMGISPHNNYSPRRPWFDLLDGQFYPGLPPHPNYLEIEAGHSLASFLTALDAGIELPIIPYLERKQLLSSLLLYYRHHLPAFGELKSVQVLSDLLHD